MNSSKKSIEVIIVGAGPSGLVAAKVLADAGITTIVFEKEINSSSRNFYSSVIYSKPLEDIFGKFWESQDGIAPIERFVSDYRAYLMVDESLASINLRSNHKLNSGTLLAFNILRGPFTGWMANKAKKEGAFIKYKTLIKELIVENGKVLGVRTDDNEEIYANVVIVAEGINSVLTKTFGLRKGELTPRQTLVFVEENIYLSKELIQEMFSLDEDKGIAIRLFTDYSFGNEGNKIHGLGYLHTNKDSISLGIGVLLSDLITNKININEYMERLKQHSAIKPYISKGIVNNYSSYILPCFKHINSKIPMPTFYVDGCLLIGGAGLFVNPFNLNFSTLAVLSGKYAAQTVIRAKSFNDYSKKPLSHYKELLEQNTLYLNFRNQNIAWKNYSSLYERDCFSIKHLDTLDYLGHSVFDGVA
ncbi:MAG: FAD-dependent monooxygenase [Candidatus Melainabacteria bacterium]|nr:FAD-dependent monooxygenase [Candidatus Melainabacteria bacterium]